MTPPEPPAEFSPIEKLREDLGDRPVRESLDPVRRKSHELIDGDQPELVVQVVGSNGKGSVVHYLENLLKVTERRTVSYVSPHLIELRERIHRNGEVLNAEPFENLLEFLPDSVHRDFTPFERLYLASLTLAVEDDADVLILEAGMGGRWDATSALPADWTILTSVDREHTQFLGETRRAILKEQLQQVPSNTGLLTPRFRDSDLRRFLKNLVVERSLTHVEVEKRGNADELNRNLALTLARRVSRTRAEALSKQLREVGRPPGRKEVLGEGNRTVILDVAHTPAALREWIRFSREHAGEDGRPLFLYGSLKGKELGELTSVLREEIPAEDLLLTEPPSPRALPPEELSTFWTESGECPPAVEPVPDDARNRLIDRDEANRTISIAGSFTLAGYFRDKLL